MNPPETSETKTKILENPEPSKAGNPTGQNSLAVVFRELGQRIITINASNGWNVTTPNDWGATTDNALSEWHFDEPHFVDSEDCMGSPVKYWRVFADRRTPPGLSSDDVVKFHVTKAGCGATPEQAVEQCRKNILSDPVAAYKIPAVLALITSEVSEALEAFRKRDRANFEEELADVLIRVLDCATGLKIDLASAVEAKLEANAKRGFRHGGKVI